MPLLEVKIMETCKGSEEVVHISKEALHGLLEAVFRKLGVPEEECDIVVDTLLEASLAGYDSHGVMRVPRYVAGLRRGEILPGADIKVLTETPACAHVDGRRGLGPVTATFGVRLASRKARQSGIGCVSIVNANDIARLGGYLKAPAEEGLIGIMMVNDAGGGPSVAPWGGVDPLLSTNPMAAGIPRRQGPPVIIDISTSVVAFGKLKMYANRGRQVPEGWIVDREGNPCTDPSTFFANPKGSALLPLGGTLAGHKGFGLSLLVDVMAGALSGAGCSTGAETELEGNGVFIQIVDPIMFGPLRQFEDQVEALVAMLKGSKKAPDTAEISIPGERAAKERRIREQEGIPVDLPTRRQLVDIMDELGIKAKDIPF
jgi:LDH2 family malate/lactate/ureidoglycolate dehydrogenase